MFTGVILFIYFVIYAYNHFDWKVNDYLIGLGCIAIFVITYLNSDAGQEDLAKTNEK